MNGTRDTLTEIAVSAALSLFLGFPLSGTSSPSFFPHVWIIAMNSKCLAKEKKINK